MITRRLERGDVTLAVQEHGERSAPTVVLVHGYPDTHAVWDGVVAELAGRFHVVTYDVRGAGESTAPATRAGYRLDALVDDLRAVVDLVSPDAPVHLVGHDWGSMQGWEALASGRLAGRVATYTSLSGPSLDHVALWFRSRLRRPTPRNLWAVARQLGRSWYIACFQLPGAGRAVGRFGPRVWPAVLRLEGVPRGDAAHHLAPTLANDFRNGRQLYAANMLRKLTRRPAAEVRIDVPVQLVVLERDRYIAGPLLDGIEEIAPRLVRRSLDGPHWSVRTRAPEVAALVAAATSGELEEQVM